MTLQRRTYTFTLDELDMIMSQLDITTPIASKVAQEITHRKKLATKLANKKPFIPSRIDDTKIARVKQLREMGWTIRNIMTETTWSYGTVYNILDKLGLTKLPR